jgi:hypothetical protein
MGRNRSILSFAFSSQIWGAGMAQNILWHMKKAFR